MNSKILLWGSLGLGAAAIIYYLTTQHPAPAQQQQVLPGGGGSNLQPQGSGGDSTANTLNTIKQVAAVGSLASQALSVVGSALGIGGEAATTVLAATPVTSALVGSSITEAAITAGATATEAAAAGAAGANAAASSLAAGGSAVEASTAGSIAAGSVIGMAASVLLPIAAAVLIFDAAFTNDANRPENLLANNQQTRIDEMPKYSTYGSGSSAVSTSPTSLKEQTGTRFTPGIQGLGRLSVSRKYEVMRLVLAKLRMAA